MKALGDQCWVNTAINLVFVISEELMTLMMTSYVQPDKNIKETEIIMLITCIMGQWNILEHKRIYTISLMYTN